MKTNCYTHDMFPLETERLILRPFKENDLKTLCRYRSDPKVAQYQLWDTPYTIENAQKFWESQKELEPDTADTWQQIAILNKASGEHLGDCAIHTMTDPRLCEVGYTLASEHQGKGYMTEALSRILKYLFVDLEALNSAKHRVSAQLDVENTASVKLLERLNFRQEGHFISDMWFKGRWSSTFQYALLRSEYLNSIHRR